MTALVTGGTGFVGRALVERLISSGRSVRCLARSPALGGELRDLGAELAPGDVVTGAGLDEAVRGADEVFHCAGLVRAWRREAYFETNAGGTARMAAAAAAAGVKRFVLVSSLAAVGPAERGGVVTEAREPRPITAYGESKLAGERALAEGGTALPWVTVRPCVVYGPRDREVLVLFRSAARGFVPYAAPRGARLSLIHVDDLADLIILAAERAPPGAVYMASDGEAHSWTDVIRAAAKALGTTARPFRIPPAALWPAAVLGGALRPFTRRPPLLSRDKLRESAQPSWVASPARARAELGWTARTGLDEGARSTAAWYREKGWL